MHPRPGDLDGMAFRISALPLLSASLDVLELPDFKRSPYLRGAPRLPVGEGATRYNTR